MGLNECFLSVSSCLNVSLKLQGFLLLEKRIIIIAQIFLRKIILKTCNSSDDIEMGSAKKIFIIVSRSQGLSLAEI